MTNDLGFLGVEEFYTSVQLRWSYTLTKRFQDFVRGTYTKHFDSHKLRCKIINIIVSLQDNHIEKLYHNFFDMSYCDANDYRKI